MGPRCLCEKRPNNNQRRGNYLGRRAVSLSDTSATAEIIERFREVQSQPICRECNGLRWSHEPRVLRLIMRMAIYAKNAIRHNTALGQEMIRVPRELFLTRQIYRPPEPIERATRNPQ